MIIGFNFPDTKYIAPPSRPGVDVVGNPTEAVSKVNIAMEMKQETESIFHSTNKIVLKFKFEF
jgi:hypothetical protein